jgi:hypothetical protein
MALSSWKVRIFVGPRRILATLSSWARKPSRRWMRVCELVRPARVLAQSTALSPPPTMRMRWFRKGSRDLTK